MEAAGATLLERTADGGSMGLNALRRGLAVRRQIGRITSWARGRRVVAHVAVDSPAANFPIAKAMRASGVHVVHLVAPQIWGWARWRIRKLRRLTSLVLCVLPFEEQWFSERKVPARFIGHPAVNRTIDLAALRERMHGLPQGAPRLGIFPGSRGHEVRANTRQLVDVYTELQGRHAGMCGVIVATNPQLARIIRRRVSVFPSGLHMITGSVDAVIAWCDLALAVSGTITLDIAAHRKPMIGVYRTGLASWLMAKLLVRSPHRLLRCETPAGQVASHRPYRQLLPGTNRDQLLHRLPRPQKVRQLQLLRDTILDRANDLRCLPGLEAPATRSALPLRFQRGRTAFLVPLHPLRHGLPRHTKQACHLDLGFAVPHGRHRFAPQVGLCHRRKRSSVFRRHGPECYPTPDGMSTI